MRRILPKVSKVLFALPWIVVALAAGDEPTPSIRAVMHKQYTVFSAPFKIIGREIDAQSLDWEKARQAGEKFATLAATLDRTTPGQGNRDSWRLLIDRHLADARAMEDATRSRDLATLRAAHGRIAASCKTCHDAHRSGRGR
jgi:cytochrome c556